MKARQKQEQEKIGYKGYYVRKTGRKAFLEDHFFSDGAPGLFVQLKQSILLVLLRLFGY